MNILVLAMLKPSFFIPFRYFHKCHFLGIYFQISILPIFAQISPSQYAFPCGFLLFEIMILHSFNH